MPSIHAENLGLVYKVRRKLTLAQTGGRFAAGGTISGSGRNQYVTAIDNVSFSLSTGDRLGLVGPNGSGKTTLLKVIYGIFEPTAGCLEVEGRVDALFNINLGFRREATGRRNILLRGLINGKAKQEMESRMDEIIEFSELGDFIDMPMKSYSQGMAARLAFSVATSLNPEILLMDEWIGAGDASFQKKARERMAELTQHAGIIVLASHNHTLLRRTCTHILELEKGRLKWFGKADNFFDSKEKSS